MIKLNDIIAASSILWARKANDLSDALAHAGPSVTDARIAWLHEMDPTEYNEFVQNFMVDRPWLAGLGGCEPADGKVRLRVMLVTCGGMPPILVDPQGHDYARYVGLLADVRSEYAEVAQAIRELEDPEPLTADDRPVVTPMNPPTVSPLFPRPVREAALRDASAACNAAGHPEKVNAVRDAYYKAAEGLMALEVALGDLEVTTRWGTLNEERQLVLASLAYFNETAIGGVL